MLSLIIGQSAKHARQELSCMHSMHLGYLEYLYVHSPIVLLPFFDDFYSSYWHVSMQRRNLCSHSFLGLDYLVRAVNLLCRLDIGGSLC